MARSLRTQSTQTIGLIADTIVTGSYGGEMIRGSLVAATAHRHHLLISDTEQDPAVEENLIEDLIARQVDGFIYATTSRDDVELPAALLEHPTVLLNCRSVEDIPAVVPDDDDGGRSAARVLLAAGHQSGIHVIGETPPRVVAARERMDGIHAALGEAGTQLEGQVNCTWWPESAFDATSSLPGQRRRPRALICLNDRIAFGVYQALAAFGLRVPDDVSVVSFDDSELASWLRPSLTSIALPMFEMGRLAVETLLTGNLGSRIQRVEMPLRERGSVRRKEHAED